jgi:hypothetical protein
MADLIYTGGLPNPPNFPSQDVGSMQVNTNSIEDWVDVDHYGFNTADNEGGYHDQVSMQNQAAPGLPGFGLNPNGVLFANNPTSPATAPAWPYWENSLGDFQITGSALAFTPSATTNGWTFLPGGLIIQWGFIANSGLTNQPVLFATANKDFPANCFNVQITPSFNAGSPIATTIGVAFPPAITGFTAVVSSAPAGLLGFYWTAIGN